MKFKLIDKDSVIRLEQKNIKIQYMILSGFLYIQNNQQNLLGGTLLFLRQKKTSKNQRLYQIPKDEKIIFKKTIQYNSINNTLSSNNNDYSINIYMREIITFNSETIVSMAFIPILRNPTETTLQLNFINNLQTDKEKEELNIEENNDIEIKFNGNLTYAFNYIK